MKAVLFFSALILTSGSLVQAAQKDGYLVKTDFKYESKARKIATQSSMILDANLKTWTSMVPSKDGMAVLGRLVENKDNTIHFEYLVVDTKTPTTIVSSPSIIAMLGEKAEITVGQENGETLAIGVVAEKTKYENAP